MTILPNNTIAIQLPEDWDFFFNAFPDISKEFSRTFIICGLGLRKVKFKLPFIIKTGIDSITLNYLLK